MSNEIVKSHGKNIEAFGERADVRELAERLQASMPGAQKLIGTEAITLAQISLAHGLDPFNGDAWYIPNSGVMVGIKGLRKAARRKAREEGGSYWTDLRRIDPEEYNEPKTSIVYECHLRDSVTSQAWAQTINTMTSAGMPYQDAIAAIGKAPLIIGVGIARPEEKSKMEIHKRSRKRAEADAIKQRYDVEFLGAVISDDEIDVPTISEPLRDEKHKSRPASEIIKELGFDVDEEVIEGDYQSEMPIE